MRRSFGMAALYAALFLLGQVPAAFIHGAAGAPISALLSVLLPACAWLLAGEPAPVPEQEIALCRRDCLPWLAAVFPFVLIVMGTAALSSFFFSIFGISDTYVPQGSIWLCLLTDALLPAMCEEFVCRKLILGELLPYDRRGAVICSALMFSLMHGKAVQLPYTFIAGLLLAGVTATCGSLLPAFAMHLANNTCSLLSQVYGAPFGSVMYPVLAVPTLVFLALSVIRKKELKRLGDVFLFGKNTFSMLCAMLSSPAVIFISAMLFLSFFGG